MHIGERWCFNYCPSLQSAAAAAYHSGLVRDIFNIGEILCAHEALFSCCCIPLSSNSQHTTHRREIVRKRSPKPLNSCCCCFALSTHSRHIALRGTPTWLEIENSECAGLHGSKLDCSHHSTWCARSAGSGISAASSPREKCFRVLGCTSCSEKARIGELGEMKPNQSANRMDLQPTHACRPCVLGCTSCSEKARICKLGGMKPNQSANRMDRLAAHSCMQAT
jgi:hypothetical protein